MVQPSIVFEPGGIVKWKRNDKHYDFTKIIIFKVVIKMTNRGKEPFIVQRGGRNTYFIWLLIFRNILYAKNWCGLIYMTKLYKLPNEESKWNILYDVYEDCWIFYMILIYAILRPELFYMIWICIIFRAHYRSLWKRLSILAKTYFNQRLGD